MSRVQAGIPHDETYFRELVEPHVDGDAVQFLGHVQGRARDELVGGALALVHMTTRPERFVGSAQVHKTSSC